MDANTTYNFNFQFVGTLQANNSSDIDTKQLSLSINNESTVPFLVVIPEPVVVIIQLALRAPRLQQLCHRRFCLLSARGTGK